MRVASTCSYSFESALDEGKGRKVWVFRTDRKMNSPVLVACLVLTKFGDDHDAEFLGAQNEFREDREDLLAAWTRKPGEEEAVVIDGGFQGPDHQGEFTQVEDGSYDPACQFKVT
jgi:hypothetical protein